MFGFSGRAKTLEVGVEYFKSHWVVLIRNAGQLQWRALRDAEKKVVVQDEFGEVVATRPAIRAFASYDEAEAWVDENLKSAKRVDKRASQAAQTYLQGLDSGHDAPFHIEATAA